MQVADVLPDVAMVQFLPARLSRLTMCRRQLGLTMHKRMTITIDEAVYEGLYRTNGKRRMGQTWSGLT